MKLFVLNIILAVIPLLGISQKLIEPDQMKSFNVTVNYPDYTVKTQMLKDKPGKLKPKVDLTYHWYTTQKIMEPKVDLMESFYMVFIILFI